MYNPELDEATATALCMVINNQIEALKAWERKLKLPFQPATQVHFFRDASISYPKPTAISAVHIGQSMNTGAMEVMRIANAFVKGEKIASET